MTREYVLVYNKHQADCMKVYYDTVAGCWFVEDAMPSSARVPEVVVAALMCLFTNMEQVGIDAEYHLEKGNIPGSVQELIDKMMRS